VFVALDIQHAVRMRMRYIVVYGLSGSTIFSGFHRASLLLVTFINQLMYSIDTVVEVKICVV